MPEIKQYFAPARRVTVSNTGVEAWTQAGRRLGSLGQETAESFRQIGELKKQEVDDLRGLEEDYRIPQLEKPGGLRLGRARQGVDQQYGSPSAANALDDAQEVAAGAAALFSKRNPALSPGTSTDIDTSTASPFNQSQYNKELAWIQNGGYNPAQPAQSTDQSMGDQDVMGGPLGVQQGNTANSGSDTGPYPDLNSIQQDVTDSSDGGGLWDNLKAAVSTGAQAVATGVGALFGSSTPTQSGTGLSTTTDANGQAATSTPIIDQAGQNIPIPISPMVGNQ